MAEALHNYYLTEEGLSLADAFKFGVSVDCLVFGYDEGKVKVLLVERGVEPYTGSWALVGDIVPLNMDLESAAINILRNLTGLENIFMEQYHAFGSVGRHPAGRVVTVGYYSLVKETDVHPLASSWARSTKWFDIDDLPPLAFDHQEILEKGIEVLKSRVRRKPVGFELLPTKFTLLELQELYEALLGCTFDKPNFRKKILSMNLLVQLDEVQKNVPHRPAKLFRFDENRYNELKKQGFAFEL